MKKFFALLMALLMVLFTAAVAAEETPATANVYVSITDDTGALVLALAEVAVTDVDEDGALTIHDALQCAHAANHENGADAYGAGMTDYGLSMSKLWGVETSGSYGYYLNNASAWSLTDPVAEGDHVKAFIYTDLTAWSDTYCFFDADVVEAAVGAEVALTLSAAGYDAEYNPITVPVEGAVIYVNGEATEIVTNADGQVTLTVEEAGEYLISARSETQNLVAPVCLVVAAAAE